MSAESAVALTGWAANGHPAAGSRPQPDGADTALLAKWQRLLETLQAFDGLAVAFSGGVDSSLLLRTSQLALHDRVVALIALTETVAQEDTHAAREIAASLGVQHRDIAVQVMGLPEVAGNTPERCYVCKREILQALCAAAREEGFSVVVEGSTADDDDVDRPGHRAVRELGVRSPLREAGLAKAEVRLLARELGLEVWDKPSGACLATRIPTGTPLDPEILERVDAAEQRLRSLDLGQIRVRCHGDIARLELLSAEFDRVLDPETRSAVLAVLGDAGFRFVCLDLAGFRSGSMNAAPIEAPDGAGGAA